MSFCFYLFLFFCHFVCVIAYAQSVQEVGCSFSQRYVYIALVHINHICFFATAEDVILRSAKHCILTELSTCSVHGVSSVTAQSHAPCKVAILTPCTWVSFTDCLRGRLRPIHNQGQFCGGGTTEIPFKATFEVTSLGQSQNQRTSEIRFSRAGHQWNANFKIQGIIPVESKASFRNENGLQASKCNDSTLQGV